MKRLTKKLVTIGLAIALTATMIMPISTAKAAEATTKESQLELKGKKPVFPKTNLTLEQFGMSGIGVIEIPMKNVKKNAEVKVSSSKVSVANATFDEDALYFETENVGKAKVKVHITQDGHTYKITLNITVVKSKKAFKSVLDTSLIEFGI